MVERATGERLLALDVFRGASVALMILVNNPGSWSHLYPPLAHARWHGVTATDLVFPFFLFAVGNALALVLPPLSQANRPALFWRKVLQRTALIFLIGLLLNWSPFVRWDAAGELAWRGADTLRVMGVLQRIALAFGAAAVIVWLFGARPRAVLLAAAVLLVGYWAACHAFGRSGDPYSLEGFFGTALDRALLGAQHLYQGEGVPFDPEGLASTVPAVAQVLLGWWAGEIIRRAREAGGIDAEVVVRLFVAGTLALALAHLWQLEMPLNKKIWTSSYVLHTTGAALLVLACLLAAIERGGRGASGWVRFFEVFGRNALFVFVLSGLVPRLLALARWASGVDAAGQPVWTSPLPWLYKTVFAGIGDDPRLGSLLFALANLLVYWLVARALDRRGLYIRV